MQVVRIVIAMGVLELKADGVLLPGLLVVLRRVLLIRLLDLLWKWQVLDYLRAREMDVVGGNESCLTLFPA